jgi:predicted amidohydrolase
VYLLGALYLMGAENRITEQMARITGLGMWAVLAQHSGGTGIGPACGGSGIWSPDGRVVARLGTGPGVAVATVG